MNTQGDFIDKLVNFWNAGEMNSFAHHISSLYKSENYKWTPYVLNEFKNRIEKQYEPEVTAEAETVDEAPEELVSDAVAEEFPFKDDEFKIIDAFQEGIFKEVYQKNKDGQSLNFNDLNLYRHHRYEFVVVKDNYIVFEGFLNQTLNYIHKWMKPSFEEVQ